VKDKLGLYITNLMTTSIDTDLPKFVRTLAFDELKKLHEDMSRFIFDHIDDIEELPEPKDAKNYKEFWTCNICGVPTHEVDYDYLSGRDHLECVLKAEQENKQLELEL